MLVTSPLILSPSQNEIVRTATACPNSPREVGDGMENPQFKLPTTITSRVIESQTSSGYSTPVLPVSPRFNDKRLSVQVPLSQVSDDAYSLRDSIPSPVPSDPVFMKTDRFLIEEKMALKDHLRIQVQVNQELRRLLVASIGEDMGFHYERIATEKAQIEIENEELKKRLSAQEEETERLTISCDVWRSKFLAGRVQLDELQENLISTQRRQRNMNTAVRALLREHRLRTEHLEEIFDTLKHLHDSLRWGRNQEGTDNNPKSDGYKGQIDEECLKLSHSISSHLLGSLKPRETRNAGFKNYLKTWNSIAPDMSCSQQLEYEVKPTMAEKYITQLLQESGSRADLALNKPLYTDPRAKPSGTVMGRFHPNAKHENLTLACCGRCKGDIHVV